MLGRPVIRANSRHSGLMGGNDSVLAGLKDVMYGDDVLKYRAYLDISHPMENGIINNWDDMTLLWEHTFRERLNIDPRGQKILLTEPPLNPKRNREKMVATMFEHFGFESVYVGVQAVLTLYAQGTRRIHLVVLTVEDCKAALSSTLATASLTSCPCTMAMRCRT